jgi:hypothetical protein
MMSTAGMAASPTAERPGSVSPLAFPVRISTTVLYAIVTASVTI